MTVREMLITLQQLPKDAEVVAFEAGCPEYCEREVDEVEGRATGSTSTSVSDETIASSAR